ncbi:protein-methionine-sulfoxide reductase catalytic subunit MsrP [Stutzerimonas urumqiensis]|uniref:protein-methionine-sulfoxide reductase catalytic subunit MsrP n=1 Tax=Stutzerimonas urumqiensis TaxID=638269 RepID=UPI003DA65E4A
MLIRVPSASRCSSADITPESVYLSRRRFMAASGAGLALGALPGVAFAQDVSPYEVPVPAEQPTWFTEKLPGVQWRAVVPVDEAITPFEDATHYNNFYEFGPDKGDPAEHADAMDIEPWTVQIDGAVEKPGTYSVADLVQPHRLEERIYRLRCVEAWSMVIPWLGFPLGELIRRAGPTGGAKYVAFETAVLPEVMPAVDSRFSLIDWPYREGLRIDEAMHPLTILAVGMYGRILEEQNGAPMRLVVPWKYGFKSIKSIVRLSLVEEQPYTTWQNLAPEEYGFYANVNPNVDHPRWTQARERRLPANLFSTNVRDTLMFNGYADEVASLYQGMDLAKFY